MRLKSHILVGVILLPALLVVDAQEKSNPVPENVSIIPCRFFPTGWISITDDMLATYMPEIFPGEMTLTRQEDWYDFWRGLEERLQLESLDDMAWLLPEADVAVDYLITLPLGDRYITWLEQRLNRADQTAEGIRRIPRDIPNDVIVAPSPSGLPRGEEVILPPLLSTGRVHIPPELAEKRKSIPRRVDYWKRQLAVRPPASHPAPLIPILKKAFTAEGIPSEFVWIAEIESSFNPAAVSSMGAGGLFQIMPLTAKRFGLTVANPDERMVPEKNAQAAARYLKMLYNEYGCWYLALAAYNAGEGRVSRLLEQCSATSFIEIIRYLPIQTQIYVPKVMAIIALREKIDPVEMWPPKDKTVNNSIRKSGLPG